MANPHFSDNSQLAGTKGPKDKRTGPAKGSLRMSLPSNGQMPSGGSGPKRDTMGVRKVSPYAQSKGV